MRAATTWWSSTTRLIRSEAFPGTGLPGVFALSGHLPGLAVRNRIIAGELSLGLTPGLPNGSSIPDINNSFVDRAQRVSDTPDERQCS
jgi:hypothetical protein